MLSLYRQVTVLAARRAVAAWPVALSLIVYALLLFGAVLALTPLGFVGGILMSFVVAACLSSYLELISQAVSGSKIRLVWDELRRTFASRLWDVVSVMFAFWIIALLTKPLKEGPNGPAVAGMLGFGIAFFFNAVPELLYQGRSRSFALLADSAKFVFAHPVAWLLPNVLFAAGALAAIGKLHFNHPAEVLIVFGSFSSPLGLASAFASLPTWSLPIALFALHFVMIFRGVLFAELTSGGNNARLRAFQSQLRG